LIGLKGKYSVSLYQLLESKVNLRKFDPQITPNENDRFIEIALKDLRDWLGTGKMYQLWNDFNKRVLQPAVEEINSNPLATTFTVKIEEVRGARNRVKAIKFFLTKTPERIKLEKSLQTTKKAKEIANESFLIPPFKGTEVYERAKKYANRLDVYKLEAEWRKFAKEKNQPIKNPELAFIGFVKKRCSA
jgi:plasmid replication initiation protein